MSAVAPRRERPAPRWRRPRRPTPDHGLSAMLAMLLVMIFVIPPLAEIGIAGRVVTSAFFSLTLVSGVWAVARSRWWAVTVAVLVLTALTLRWMRLVHGSEPTVVASMLGFVFCVLVAAIVVTEVLRAGRITFHRIRGAVAVYLLLGMAWAFAYESVAIAFPSAFVFANVANMDPERRIAHLMYFSFVTLTTVGYGDVTATHPVARSLVTIEALIGQLFPAILLARLVSMELLHRVEIDKENRA